MSQDSIIILYAYRTYQYHLYHITSTTTNRGIKINIQYHNIIYIIMYIIL